MTDDIKEMVDFLKRGFSTDREKWCEDARGVFEGLLTAGVRYKKVGIDEVKVRVSSSKKSDTLLWAAYLNPANIEGGAYGGTSLVIFASKNKPALLTFCVGTQGLAPDEKILGNPGHARKLSAICKYLNTNYGNGQQVAWSKDNPCKTDVLIPAKVASYLNPDGDEDYTHLYFNASVNYNIRRSYAAVCSFRPYRTSRRSICGNSGSSFINGCNGSCDIHASDKE